MQALITNFNKLEESMRKKYQSKVAAKNFLGAVVNPNYCLKIFCKSRFATAPLLILFVIFYSVSCSYRPIFDQNEKYLYAGEEKAQSDFENCKKSAEKYLYEYKAERAAKEAGRKAVIGGVVGAASGLLFGKGIKSSLIGTAIGAGVGATIGAIGVIGEDKVKPDEMKQRYVSGCLAKKGYSIMGWR